MTTPEEFHAEDVPCADGTVTPSLGCPNPACSFHEFVKLDGWKAAA
ncbi:hypothetical protein LCGC14_1523990 [marine sediment metagenome]|uniref:Uncharacterized protein n=1 Tax=marine sediment metagenome TaxID=412755 RepID=A0A0F9LYQ9_9ZZZZ